MTLVKRVITLEFQLGLGANFGDSGSDTIEVKGVRTSVTLNQAGGRAMTSADIKVYGLPLDVMNQLTILGAPLDDSKHNTVIISAGDAGGPLSVVFAGTIMEAWVDARNAPEICLIVGAKDGALLALRPTIPVSFKGTVDVATIVSYIAEVANMGFQNNGVSVQTTSPYYPNTVLSQLQDLADHYDFNAVVETAGGDANANSSKIIIWPKGTARPSSVPMLSRATGLIGYPMHTQQGIELETLFNPAIVFGGDVMVESDLKPANGRWNVFQISHDLESETPNGKWFTSINCTVFGSNPLGIAGGR
jgi:hypothetical protein